jgi:hypothetical protein
MTTSRNLVKEDFGNLPASLGIVLRGRYADLHSFLIDIEDRLPPGCSVLYKKFAPGGLWIRSEGSDD